MRKIQIIIGAVTVAALVHEGEIFICANDIVKAKGLVIDLTALVESTNFNASDSVEAAKLANLIDTEQKEYNTIFNQHDSLTHQLLELRKQHRRLSDLNAKGLMQADINRIKTNVNELAEKLREKQLRLENLTSSKSTLNDIPELVKGNELHPLIS